MTVDLLILIIFIF